jgi:DMSO/TMAO reductase YedYZ molybdopterin-dependent catalytic subunit
MGEEDSMIHTISRRAAIQGGAAFAGLAALGFPAWASAQPSTEEVIPWTDVPQGFDPSAGPAPHSLDTRTIDKSSFITPTDDFFAVQHYGPAQVDPATYKLRVSGLVNKEMELTLDQLKRRPRTELIAGFECSGNSSTRLNTLAGNARWTGTSLAALLKEAGLKSTAREVVYFGADHGTEEISHGGAPLEKYEQNFGRSLAVEDALHLDALLVWEMNGEPLPAKNGGPVRMLVPGWYGVCNAKWLNHIQIQDRRFMGRFMARDYVTLIQRKDGDQTIWEETSVSRIQLKSMVARLARLARDGGSIVATGFVLNDGTPLRSIELRVDDGPWQAATPDRQNTKYSWKLFTCEFAAPGPGDHTIVSRATDVNGAVQPEAADLQTKKSRWENNAQFVRKFNL